MSTRRALAVLGGSVVVAALVVVGAVLLVDRGTGAEEHRYVIPAGTAERIEAGEPLEVLPTELRVQAGDDLTVVNEDDEAHFIGVASVQPGETFTYTFPSVGTFESTCTVHRRGAIEIIVEA